MMKTALRPLLSVLCLAAALLQPACNIITERPVLAQVAVEYATIKVVQERPEYAARVIEIAGFLRDHAGDTAATSVALLEVAVREQIQWEKLDAADSRLVDLLIAAVREELVARLGDGPLSPENALIVAQVAGWIVDAATSVAPPSAALRAPSSAVFSVGVTMKSLVAPGGARPGDLALRATGRHRMEPSDGTPAPGVAGACPFNAVARAAVTAGPRVSFPHQTHIASELAAGRSVPSGAAATRPAAQQTGTPAPRNVHTSARA